MTTKRSLFISMLCLFTVVNLRAQQKVNFNQGLSSKSTGQGISNALYKSTNNTVLLTQDFSSTTFPPTGWTMNIVTGTLAGCVVLVHKPMQISAHRIPQPPTAMPS